MTLITDLTERIAGNIDGTEEYIVNVGTTDYKVLGSSITAAVAATHALYVISNDAIVNRIDSDKLNLAGGTMTGALTLSGAPSSGLHATTKTYVDGLLAAKADATGQSFGATTTGTTAADTTETTTLATTAYVGSKIGYDVFKKTVVNTATQVLTYALRGTIFVTRTTTGACTITLPDSSALTSAARTEYYIVDAGNNAETYNITINCAGSDTFLDGTTTMLITGDGASVLLAVNGTTWIPKDLDATGSTTQAGIARLATNAEALALTNATAVVTPNELGNVFDQELYNSTVISAASKTFVEADSGKWYVTRTATGTCALTLPDPSALTTPSRFVVEVWDVETAGTNAITINTTAGNIDGASSTTISADKSGMVFINDGTNYFTIANTARATSSQAGTTNYLPKFDSTGVVLEDSLILDDGDQIGINGAVDSSSFMKVRNASFVSTLDIVNTTTSGSNISGEFATTGIGGSTNTGVKATASGGSSTNKAFDNTQSVTSGSNYAGYVCNINGVGGSVTTKGVSVQCSNTQGAVTGLESFVTGAATTNTALNLNSTGGSTNYSINISSGDIKMSSNGINFLLDTAVGTEFGTATSQKLAFYGSTPIIQQTSTSQTAATFAANTSGISDDTATWDGYTMGDVVAILQAFGFIA